MDNFRGFCDKRYTFSATLCFHGFRSFLLQKAINTPVNAISPTSATHLTDKLTRLSRLLSGKAVATSDSAHISASGHPAGIVFCKDLLAKKFVVSDSVFILFLLFARPAAR